MTQKSCFLMVAEPGFEATLKLQKQLLTEHSVFSKPRYFHSYAVCAIIRIQVAVRYKAATSWV